MYQSMTTLTLVQVKLSNKIKSNLAISTVPYARNMAGCTNRTAIMTVISIILIVLLSKGMGAQEAHEGMDMLIRTVQIKENAKKQIMLR